MASKYYVMNEQLKSTAQFLNNLAVASMTVGMFTPFFAWALNANPFTRPPLSVLAFGLVFGLALRGASVLWLTSLVPE
jgi:hypothetical protein